MHDHSTQIAGDQRALLSARFLLGLLATSVVTAGCGESPAAPLPRTVVISTVVNVDGLSDEVIVNVPDMTRSIGLVIEGNPNGLYALGAFTTPDGITQLDLPSAALATTMQASYRDEQIGQMPGALFQSIRLGTFTHVYPYRPDQSLPAGQLRLRVASDMPGDVKITALMPPENGGNVLHVNLVVVSDTRTVTEPPAFIAEARLLLAQAGVELELDQIVPIRGSALARITESTEPQENPTSMTAMLPSLVKALALGESLDLFWVDSLPAGIGGLALGTPGPPVRGSGYFGVAFVETGGPANTGRVLAHEICHFLALQHVQNVGVSGRLYPDPLDDTEVGISNLMTRGSALTPNQAWSLLRSPLLQVP